MATYYINADTGNDTTGDGSSSLPWLTPSKAIGSSTTGDVIILQNATSSYAWGGNFSSKSITMRGESLSNVTVDALGTLQTFNLDGGTVVIENINFKGLVITSAQNGGFKQQSSTGSFTFNNCVFKENQINAGYSGIFVTGAISSVTTNFNTCLFYDNTSNSLKAPFGVICVVWYINMVNCVVHFNGASGLELGNFSQGYGGTSTSKTFTNCILYGTQANTPPIGGRYNYTCYYGVGSETIGTNIINADPLFIDPANGNYSLSPSSPCIDAGTLV